jgi:hypothetical protein
MMHGHRATFLETLVNRLAISASVALCAWGVGSGTAGYGFQLEWARQTGTPADDRSWFTSGNTVTFDGAGSSFFAGTTNGAPTVPGGGPWDGILVDTIRPERCSGQHSLARASTKK